MTYSVHQAKLLDLVEQGEEVTIVRHGEPVARLTRAPKKKKKIAFDSMKDEITLTEGREKPMTDQEMKEFFGG